MVQETDDKSVGCTGQCRTCRQIGQVLDQQGCAGPRGWRLVLACTGAFLVPAGLAAAGAVIFRGSQAGQALAAAGGLVFGAVLAWLVGRRFSSPGKEKA